MPKKWEESIPLGKRTARTRDDDAHAFPKSPGCGLWPYPGYLLAQAGFAGGQHVQVGRKRIVIEPAT